MDGHLSRRDLLVTGLASSFVIGFPWALSADDGSKAWKDALEAMKKRGLPGLAIVIPDDAAARTNLGRAIERLLPVTSRWDDTLVPAAPFALEAVWVCVPASVAQAKAGETAVLFDPEGKRVAGGAIDFSTDEKFVRSARALLHGEGRLEARARAERANAKIAGDLDGVKDGAALERLVASLDRCIASLVHLLETSGDDQVKNAVARALARAYAGHARDRRAFPFGVSWGDGERVHEACPPCGEGSTTLQTRKFLDFLTR